MSKALKPVFEADESEEGAAQSAASLGPDGGPLVAANVSYDDEAFDEGDDFAWVDEELSDEELAALGEEDFDDDEFDDDELLEEELALLEENPDAFADDAAAFEDAAIGGVENDEAFLGADVALAPTDDRVLDEIDDAGPDVEAVEPPMESAALVASAPVASATLAEDEEYDSEISEYGEEGEDHRPVPRIAIHAFCETPGVTALLEKAAVDRRLSKAHLTMHMGGIAKAVDHFQGSSTPNLIMLETVDAGPALFAQLGQLAEVCDPSTKVIIIGRVNDIGLYRELMSQGVSDYIVRPKSPLQFIKSIANLYADPSAPPIGRTVAFVGARGGVGSSTIAHNVAWAAAEEFECDTIILDLDLPFGTASLDFEQDPTSGLVEALSSPERLDDVLLDRLLQKHTDRLSLFTAPNLLDRDYDLDDQAFETVIDVVRGAAPTIVVDVPHLWTGWSKRILQTADEIVITAAPDLASFRNTKNLVDVVSGARPNDASPLLVLNQYDPKVSSVQAEQFVEHVGIEPAVIINWEPQLFHAAATNAAPILEVGSKSKTALHLREIASRILGREQSFTKRSAFSLSGLFKK
ncbi:MAG: hypothetical protein AAGJ87_03120 [Pseudomonadota bacterium]